MPKPSCGRFRQHELEAKRDLAPLAGRTQAPDAGFKSGRAEWAEQWNSLHGGAEPTKIDVCQAAFHLVAEIEIEHDVVVVNPSD